VKKFFRTFFRTNKTRLKLSVKKRQEGKMNLYEQRVCNLASTRLSSTKLSSTRLASTRLDSTRLASTRPASTRPASTRLSRKLKNGSVD
jgi:hypothetical protein